ncbi:prepilin peptidase [Rubricoccus marinus]|uniref:Prepilin leader peptidase/N-methyltransferase n=1 Tax=Rubricoccus marinus TaxID=716817 RepID=A0A259TU65_9BACT|nr:A24 family peptidase [Rubricoccus marinus]OZC01271.1 hypothetical protein BSZ36_17645 [Rubricoccus marinus]
MAPALASVAVLGLVFGSFLNVAAYRLPQRRSLSPRSACPACSHALAWRDLIPLVSYGLLRGRCRHCDARVPLQYPFVEVAAALAFVAVASRAASLAPLLPTVSSTGPVGGGAFVWAVVAFIGFAATLVATVTDLRHGTVPDRLSLSAGALVLIVLVALAPAWLPSRLVAAVAAAAVALALRGLGSIAFGRPGFGLGDAKLLAVLGLALGWYALWALYLGILVAGLAGAVGLATGRLSRHQPVPFVPSLLVGATLWIAVWPHGPFP